MAPSIPCIQLTLSKRQGDHTAGRGMLSKIRHRIYESVYLGSGVLLGALLLHDWGKLLVEIGYLLVGVPDPEDCLFPKVLPQQLEADGHPLRIEAGRNRNPR